MPPLGLPKLNRNPGRLLGHLRTPLFADEQEEFMRQIEELKEGTAKKEAELVEIKKAQVANVSVHNLKFPCYVLINHRLLGT